jgi:hypothetical protein
MHLDQFLLISPKNNFYCLKILISSLNPKTLASQSSWKKFQTFFLFFFALTKEKNSQSQSHKVVNLRQWNTKLINTKLTRGVTLWFTFKKLLYLKKAKEEEEFMGNSNIWACKNIPNLQNNPLKQNPKSFNILLLLLLELYYN